MRIHQLLHGYSEGHKLLAGSISNIPPKDRKKLAVLSDWDEYATGRDDDSYITCYPLPEGNYYAIAKTWYANDMDRPGCVWTHTLLIDCSDDFEFLDLRQLFYCFNRPVEGKYSEYEKPIELNEDKWNDKNNPIQLFDEPSLGYWLQNLLYGKTALIFSVEKPSVYYQLLVLSIISHLPKSLMYRFSLCSGTGRVRKYENKVFDLQFITVYKNSIPRLSQPIAENTDIDGWCKFIANSILTGGDSVPRLVSRFSSDIGDSVERYVAVIIVYELLDRLKEPGKQNISKFNIVLKVISEVFPLEEDGKYFKSVILSQGLTKYFFDEKEFIFQMAATPYSHSFNYEDFDFSDRLDDYLSKNTVREYAECVDDLLQKKIKSPYSDLVCKKVAKAYSDEEIEFLFYYHLPFYLDLIRRRPSILCNNVWLYADYCKFKDVFIVFCQHIPEDFKDWEGLLNKLINNRLNISQSFLEIVSKYVNNLTEVLLNKINVNKNIDHPWKDYCEKHPQDTILWLKSQERVNSAIVKIILKSIDPESEMVKKTCSSNWKALLFVNIERELLIQFSTFIFVLSYRTDRNDISFALYKKSFLPIYEATAQNEIGHYWFKIEQYCPKSYLNLKKNRCNMLRKGFVSRMLLEHRDASIAMHFTTNNSLNKKLFELVSK